MKILLVAGARPNFMKIAPIVRELRERKIKNLTWKIIHTGQHYDYAMSQSFFDDFELPEPDYFLEVGSGSHAGQTASIMIGFEAVCEDERPDVVIVVGDVNSTLGCSIVAKKMGIKVAHVEAGLRSFDLAMPEEINRMVTDSITDYFFVTEKSGVENLRREGKPEDQIYFVGHVMIDNLFHQLDRVNNGAPPSEGAVVALKEKLGRYGFLTLHRPANVDDRDVLAGIVEALNTIAEENIPIVFPVHPRTRKMLDRFQLHFSPKIHQLSPLGFRDALYLWKDAEFLLTDSGGLQEETTALCVPCFTIRENTERPITVTLGTNTLVGCAKKGILAAISDFYNGNRKKGQIPELWDGQAAKRIISTLLAE